MLTDIDPTTDKIIQAVSDIASDSASGPDGFSVQLIKNCKVELGLPLKLIANKSLATGTVPLSLKEGIVTPIHKGENKGLAKNYRPGTHIIKIIERVVRKRLTEHLEKLGAFNRVSMGSGKVAPVCHSNSIKKTY